MLDDRCILQLRTERYAGEKLKGKRPCSIRSYSRGLGEEEVNNTIDSGALPTLLGSLEIKDNSFACRAKIAFEFLELAYG